EPQRIHATRLALIAVDRAQQLAELPRISDCGAIRRLDWLQCAAQVRTRIVFTAPCSDAIAHYTTGQCSRSMRGFVLPLGLQTPTDGQNFGRSQLLDVDGTDARVEPVIQEPLRLRERLRIQAGALELQVFTGERRERISRRL